jgi:ubiquinone/menaquinone biosynthesis C-methylase UbiE
MPLPRTPEPELMDSATEADDYDRMDFSAVNDRFMQDARSFFGSPTALLDVGTGTGRIPLAFVAGGLPERLVAVDAAPAMLARAEANRLATPGAASIRFLEGNATALAFEAKSFDAVMSNSLVHHLPSPVPFFREVGRVCRGGAKVFVRDLARPDSSARVDELTDTYAGAPTDATGADLERFERQRSLFHASLHAAFTVDEVRAMAAVAGLLGADVRMTSDRHWTLTWTKP